MTTIDFKIRPSKVKLTKFQWKVLEVAATIPLGETRTYKWVAQKAGSPLAVRAVGQALRRNPYPLIIPCHRVVKSDGTLGGYEGGPSGKKRELLRIEREVIDQLKGHGTSNAVREKARRTSPPPCQNKNRKAK